MVIGGFGASILHGIRTFRLSTQHQDEQIRGQLTPLHDRPHTKKPFQEDVIDDIFGVSIIQSIWTLLQKFGPKPNASKKNQSM